jgi:hypothetical protein
VQTGPQELAEVGTWRSGWGKKSPFPLPLLYSLTGVKPVVLCPLGAIARGMPNPQVAVYLLSVCRLPHLFFQAALLSQGSCQPIGNQFFCSFFFFSLKPIARWAD